MMITIDLTSFLIVLIAIPVTIFLSQFAYQFAKDIRPLQQNKYVTNLIKENNQVWREYLDLQQEFRELKDDVE